MARDHARIQTARWRNEDWRGLTPDAQWTYDTLLTQEALSYAGVLDYRAGRVASLAKGMTSRRVDAAVRVLEDGRFVVVDRMTEELLVRTYVRHDGVLDRSNMGKAVARALVKVVSLELRHAVIAELARHYIDKPLLSGWVGFRELNPDDMDRVTAMASTMPLPIASKEA